MLRRCQASGEPLSPVELSALLSAPLSTVSYHVAVLVERGAINLAGTHQVRGAVKHFYEMAVTDNLTVVAFLDETASADEDLMPTSS